jgi:hypothetical protein
MKEFLLKIPNENFELAIQMLKKLGAEIQVIKSKAKVARKTPTKKKRRRQIKI